MESTDRTPTSLWHRRAWTSLVHGGLWMLLLILYRLRKADVIELPRGLWDSVSLLAPDIGSALLIISIWWLLARIWPRRSPWLWPLVFGSSLIGLYALTIVEHSYFLHTGIRLHSNLLSYTAQNTKTVLGIVAFGMDSAFRERCLWGLLFLTLGFLISRRLIASGPPLPKRAIMIFTLAGALLLAVPATRPVRNAGFASGLLTELVRKAPDTEGLMADLPDAMRPQRPVYVAPVLEGAATRRPNIVLLILESTRVDHTPPYAPEAVDTAPALAELARSSLVFDTAYTAVTHTSKALVGILCGMFPRLEMDISEPFEGNLPLTCLPHLLQELGYRTSFLQTALGIFENRPGLVRNMGFQQAAFQETLESLGYPRVGYLGMSEAAMLGPAIDWIREGGEEPFFLTLLTITPHHPYQTPGQPRAEGLEEQKEAYRLSLVHQDLFAGALADGLRALELLEDTVLIVLGDHGEAFGEHLRMQHNIVPYEEVVRTPLLLHAPALLGAGRRVGGLRHHVDLLPTLLDLLGVPWQGTLPGRSLLAEGHKRVFSSCWFTHSCLALREGDRKVVYHYGQRPLEIFDLAADPNERHNLAPTLPAEEVAFREQQLLAWKLGIDTFWDAYPSAKGDFVWWNRKAGGTPP